MVKVSVACLLSGLLAVPRLVGVLAAVETCYTDETEPCSCDLQSVGVTLDYNGKQYIHVAVVFHVLSIVECMIVGYPYTQAPPL